MAKHQRGRLAGTLLKGEFLPGVSGLLRAGSSPARMTCSSILDETSIHIRARPNMVRRIVALSARSASRMQSRAYWRKSAREVMTNPPRFFASSIAFLTLDAQDRLRL